MSHRVFRSKKEVLYFLETGLSRKKRKMENADANNDGGNSNVNKAVSRKLLCISSFSFCSLLQGESRHPSDNHLCFWSFEPVYTQQADSSGGQKQKKASRAPPLPPPNFDWNNCPEQVQWVLKDASTNTWIPYINNEEVPESVRKEWAAALEYLKYKSKA